MNAPTIALSEDLSPWVMWTTLVLLCLALVMLILEARNHEGRRGWLFASGALAALLFAAAVFRPVSVDAKTTPFGPRIVALIDDSRRLLLPEAERTRRDLAVTAMQQLQKRYSDARLSISAFADGELYPFDPAATPIRTGSDLTYALSALMRAPGERPAAVVVVSDGRLSRPGEDAADTLLQQLGPGADVPVHTVSLLRDAPPDVSVRRVEAAGAAVAHQSLAVTVEVGCAGGIRCDEVPVTIRELLSGEPALTLASGTAPIKDGVGRIELDVTLDRAGTRVLEVSIDAQPGDTIPENDKRYLGFSVAKERVRLLHLAGRPTYDVRALRTWLKSDESVDTVAFFILRGETDDPAATEQELALIRFPVDELFTEHLASFDAIILQDIDAVRYKLAQYLPRLTAYVKRGGGLIMVGGPSSFAGGNYAGTPLDAVIPVEQPRNEKPFDSEQFVPLATEAGRTAPVTRNLRSLLDGQLPAMAGANRLGHPKPGSIVLWEHPKLRTGGRPMPILALGESGDGRAIALGLDSTHRLAFGELAATVTGRAYGALWDGLLGWLMRDPRYEAARVDLLDACLAGHPATLRIQRLPGMSGNVALSIEALNENKSPRYDQSVEADARGTLEVPLRPLPAGGYTAKVSIGAAPATRFDFGCEAGGEAWVDSRPDATRLERLANATGGLAVDLQEIEELPLPDMAQITAERHVAPLVPAWVWTLLAAVTLGAHWVLRRQGGLA